METGFRAAALPYSNAMAFVYVHVQCTVPAIKAVLYIEINQCCHSCRCRQPPEGLHYCGRRGRQPAAPLPTAGQAPRQISRGQTGDIPASVVLYAAAKQSRNRFPTQGGGFWMPGTGGAINVSTAAESAAPADATAESAAPADTAAGYGAVSAMPADTASEDGPLTSSPPSRGQSSGGAL